MLQAHTARRNHEQTAILLNANAKQVSPRVRDSLSGLVPAESLFFSRDRDDAHRIADTVVSRGFDTVFTGGGDGTFVSWVNHILDRAETRSRPVAPLRRPGARHRQRRGRDGRRQAGRHRRPPPPPLRRGPARPPARPRHLRGAAHPFAGVGHRCRRPERLQLAAAAGWAARAGRAGRAGMRGYGLAIALRSAPAPGVPAAPRSTARSSNTGAPAWRLDAAGDRVGRAIENGELLYAGPCMLAAGSTVPYYGFRLRAFPFAGRRAPP